MNYSKMTPNELAEEFIKLGTENGITMLNGDYRRGNRKIAGPSTGSVFDALLE